MTTPTRREEIVCVKHKVVHAVVQSEHGKRDAFTALALPPLGRRCYSCA